MCGILFIVDAQAWQNKTEQAKSIDSDHQKLEACHFAEGLTCRGPDQTGVINIDAVDGRGALTFASSLLQLRGCQPAPTPHIDAASGNILLWNGEVFGGLEVAPGANDGLVLLQQLTQSTGGIPGVLSKLRGPWALVFWHAATKTLWFGRDVLGRRSLLLHAPTPHLTQFILTSSVPLAADVDCSGFCELQPGMYSAALKFEQGGSMEVGEPTKFDWKDDELVRIQAFRRSPELMRPEEGNSSAATGLQEEATQDVLRVLREAVATRCRCIDILHAVDVGLSTDPQPSPAKILILFSGGADSTLLAALAHETLPPDEPIDLLSICFDGGNSPDRASALDAFAELSVMAPKRRWRLIAADRTLQDLEAARARLLRLLAPSDTVMDLNIGAALWLAAAGFGILMRLNDSTPSGGGEFTAVEQLGQEFCSAARCVLLGHGADELFGGYGRHRTKFNGGGWQGLAEELALDVKRLWVRNLGRDDRLIADRGREARHPFLDEGVVAAALRWPLPALTDLRLPPGEGDKLALRGCLRALGLPRAASRVKRAIQFGTRLAQASNRAEFGGTKRANARSAGSLRLGDVGGAPQP